MRCMADEDDDKESTITKCVSSALCMAFMQGNCATQWNALPCEKCRRTVVVMWATFFFT